MTKREFNKFENANAILNGMEDCVDEFVQGFINLHKQPIDNHYMYDWLLRSLVDVVKINHSILWVACGTAGYSRLFKNINRFVGIDFSAKMIDAAKTINTNKNIDFVFHCVTLEKFSTEELFDVIYLGPYGNNVPYTYEALKKAKKLLNDDGMIFCAFPDPEFKGFYSRFKEFIKNLIIHKNLDYDPVKKLEKMLKKSKLEVYIKLRMKTDIGHSYCYVVKS